MMVAQLPGYLSAAYFIERLGRKKSLALYFLGMAVTAILWALVTNTVQLIVVTLLLSFFTLGVWGLVYAYTPELYPTSMRGTGMVWLELFASSKSVSIVWPVFPPSFSAFSVWDSSSYF